MLDTTRTRVNAAMHQDALGVNREVRVGEGLQSLCENRDDLSGHGFSRAANAAKSARL